MEPFQLRLGREFESYIKQDWSKSELGADYQDEKYIVYNPKADKKGSPWSGPST